jgi:ABC-type multidrug transport system permease subunit
MFETTKVIFTPMILLGGLFLNQGSIPVWIEWLKYISFIKYAFEILIINEMEGLTFTCEPNEMKNGTCPIESALLYFFIFTHTFFFLCVLSAGEDVIKSLSLDAPETSIWSNFLYMLALYFLFGFLAYLLLALTAGRKKGT